MKNIKTQILQFQNCFHDAENIIGFYRSTNASTCHKNAKYENQ